MTVSYVNLMRAQAKPHALQPSVTQQSISTAQILASAQEVRARLMGIAKPKRVTVAPAPAEVPPEEPKPVAPPPHKSVPINMLTPCSWRFLLALVSLRSRIAAKTILGRSKSRHVVEARHELMRLIYQHTQCSLPMLGKMLNRDHTTVLHALQKLGANFKLVEMLPDTAARSRPKVPNLKRRDFLLVASETKYRPHAWPTAETIIKEACERHGITEAAFGSRRRTPSMMLARQEACYRMSKETVLTLNQIGKLVGNRDHATVLYSVRVHEARLKGQLPSWERKLTNG